jgi:hypothetical protein
MKSKRNNCEALLKVIPVMETGLRASIKGISEDLLNYNFASHKMTIGQIVIHTMSWPRYFLSDEPPWELTKDTCRPCTYPLTLVFVRDVISDGIQAMTEFLQNTNDDLLEIDKKGEKGKGYILYRLQLHTLVHSNQISYLRSLKDPSWDFGEYFGDMATTLIGLDYSTTKDLAIPGF